MSMLPDEYTCKARLSPVFLLVLPTALAITAVVGGTAVDTLETWGKLFAGGTFTTLVVGSLLMLANQVGRAGRKQQDYLFHIWGGPPLNNAICGKGTEDHRATWSRVRGFLSQRIGVENPDNLDDAKSRDLETELKTLTRSHSDFPLVFQENCNYGFRRNLYGLKRWGLASASIAVVVGGLLLFADLSKPLWPPLPWATLIVGLFAFLGWLLVTPMFVRHAAMPYVAAMREAGVKLINDARDAAQSSVPNKENVA